MTFICPKCRSRFAEPLKRCPHDRRRVVEDLAGQNIAGRYTIKELLGVGGMDSSVWMAVQAPIHRPVAIKLLPPAEGDSAERFARGARIASNLNHPNITVVHDYGRTADGRLYLVMELLEGRTLHEVLRGGALGVDRALLITDQILKALDHAHKKKVVHRDIKPGNLFLTKTGDDTDFVKVLDFGIARFIDPHDSFSEEPGQEITTTRQICGTPQYMAPEQIALGAIDGRTDLYALGVVLYRMLTGTLPFASKDHRELFRAHLSQVPPTFADVRAGIDAPDLEALVMRVLAKAPDDRFASPAEMRRALRQLRFRRGVHDDELTPMSGAVSAPNSFNVLAPITGVSAVESQNMTVDIVAPRRQLWGPLLILLLLLVGVGVFVWQTQRPDDAVADPVAAVTPESTPAGAVDSTAPATAAPPSMAPVVDAGVVADAAPDAAPVPDAAPTAPPSQLVWASEVKITSAPSRATVKQDGKVLGRTPLTVALPAGTHRLSLARGKAVATLRITIRDGDEPETFHAVLHKRRARAPTTESPRPAPKAAVTDAPTISAATDAPKSTVRMKLLDEDEARDFKVNADKAKPAAPATRKPSINLLGP